MPSLARAALLLMPALLALTACGADGPPVPPPATDSQPRTGLQFSGDARMGVVKNGL